ncbi:MAG: hypothetical protein ACPL7O_11165, partial [Armatimonadota bacterium]
EDSYIVCNIARVRNSRWILVFGPDHRPGEPAKAMPPELRITVRPIESAKGAWFSPRLCWQCDRAD